MMLNDSSSPPPPPPSSPPPLQAVRTRPPAARAATGRIRRLFIVFLSWCGVVAHVGEAFARMGRWALATPHRAAEAGQRSCLAHGWGGAAAMLRSLAAKNDKHSAVHTY